MIELQELLDFFENQADLHQVIFFGISPLQEEIIEFERYENWLKQGKHGDMHFLANNLHCRKDPRNLLDKSTTAICFGFNYAQKKDELLNQKPTIARYARFKDYHKSLRKIGELIFNNFLEKFGSDYFGRITVDSAPLMERVIAERTGRGFIGKNTLFITPDKGSYFLLFEIILTGNFPSQKIQKIDHTQRGETGGCGSCKRCKVHCPTGALDTDYQLDARKCLSYLTIENRDVIPVKYWQYLKLTIFGCDICQNVCPYNRKTQSIDTSQLYLKTLPDLADIVMMDQESYVKYFGGTSLTRAKKEGLQRNALIAMVVLQHPKLEDVLRYLEVNPHSLLEKTVAQIAEFEGLS